MGFLQVRARLAWYLQYFLEDSCGCKNLNIAWYSQHTSELRTVEKEMPIRSRREQMWIRREDKEKRRRLE